jgi:tRNA pseudouridine38-40 synthase
MPSESDTSHQPLATSHFFRYALTIEYDGTHLCGWQRQDDVPTAQQCVEDAVFAFSGERVTLQAAGRTDAGVHACAMVAHLDLSRAWEPFRILEALNHYLSFDGHVAVLAVEAKPDAFHARFSATKRHYRYEIVQRRAALALERTRAWHIPVALDTALMREAATHLLGTHDFTSFRDTECQAKSPIKTLDYLTVTEQNIPHGTRIRVETGSRSFLHHQVRIMVGTLALIGKGRVSPDAIPQMLTARKRAAAGPTAPAHGLYFVRVEY